MEFAISVGLVADALLVISASILTRLMTMNPASVHTGYAYEWIYRKWRAFSKEMFKRGESITVCEHELIHGLTDFKAKAGLHELATYRGNPVCY
ncbi:hypothetical protein ACFLW6_03580 [Chloroflexota bacterium]